MFDKDGDGHITYDELCDVMRLLGNNPTEEDLKAIMDELDTNSESDIGCICTTRMYTQVEFLISNTTLYKYYQ